MFLADSTKIQTLLQENRTNRLWKKIAVWYHSFWCKLVFAHSNVKKTLKYVRIHSEKNVNFVKRENQQFNKSPKVKQSRPATKVDQKVWVLKFDLKIRNKKSTQSFFKEKQDFFFFLKKQQIRPPLINFSLLYDPTYQTKKHQWRRPQQFSLMEFSIFKERIEEITRVKLSPPRRNTENLVNI